MIPAAALPFVKMEGLGNDFLVVDLRTSGADPAPLSWLSAPPVIQRICDRRRGVGGDGILLLLPARGADAAARMVVWNADGSEAQMCGNGLRCVAKFLRDDAAAAGRVTDRFWIETGAGRLGCTFCPPEADTQADADDVFELLMGAPRLRRAELPMAGDPASTCLDEPLSLTGPAGPETTPLHVTAVSMGNPHAVIFPAPGTVPDFAALYALAGMWGPRIETDALFPARTNVEFVRATGPRAFELVVWERGCGLTEACGTGACATAVAACLLGHAREGEWQALRLPGGVLGVCVEPGHTDVRLRGPARAVFRGELDPARFGVG